MRSCCATSTTDDVSGFPTKGGERQAVDADGQPVCNTLVRANTPRGTADPRSPVLSPQHSRVRATPYRVPSKLRDVLLRTPTYVQLCTE
jgi:putative heme iron utilization protein